MKILVTGSSGFIGFHVVKSLLKRGNEVLGVDNHTNYYDVQLKHSRLNILKNYQNFSFEKVDISDSKEINRIFKSFEPQKVVNLAAQPGVRYSIDNPHEYMKSNLVGFLNVIEMCRHFDVESFIYASSSSVYGNNNDIPFNTNSETSRPISFYGATKKSNELIAHSYSDLFGLRCVGLRYFTVYGPWYRPDMAIFKFTKSISEDIAISVYNNGKMKRDFTYIDDIVDGTIAAIDHKCEYEIYNLGNNKSENLLDMISIIEKYLSKKATLEFKPLQLGDPEITYANIEKSTRDLGFSPKVSLKKGIPNFIDWYKEYYNAQF